MIQSIQIGAARALFVCWYAGSVESGEHDGPRADPGEDWTDVAPDTPRCALRSADQFLAEIRKMNEDNWSQVVLRQEVRNNPELFGHYLAMQALSHGVAWNDDYRDHGLALPYWEYQPDSDWDNFQETPQEALTDTHTDPEVRQAYRVWRSL